MGNALSVARWCWGLPLGVGVAVFLLWLLTRWDWLMLAGLIDIYVGLACLVPGLLAAGAAWQHGRHAGLSRRQAARRPMLAAALLLSNVAVAGGLAWTAVLIRTLYVVTVHNASGARLTDVRISGGGCEERIEALEPGAEARRSFWVRDDGELRVLVRLGEQTREAVVDGYVTHGEGGDLLVTVGEDGRMTALDAAARAR